MVSSVAASAEQNSVVSDLVKHHNKIKKLDAEEDVSELPFFKRIIRTLQGRWVRMIVFASACFFTSALYYGWQQYQLLLFKSGAYSWLCDEANLNEEGLCEAQENAVATMYSIAAGCEYASAALGGTLLDHIGPRKTGFIGEAMFGIGTLMLALSSEKAPMYIPAMIVIGTSVNVTCFPSLCTIETFPKWHGLMVGLMLAAENAATGIPPALYSILQHNETFTFRGLWLCYLAVIWAPIFILYMIALPGARDFENMLKLQRKQMMAQAKNDRKKVEALNDSPSAGATPLTENATPVQSVSTTDTEESVQIIQRKASWSEFLKNALTFDLAIMALFFFSMNIMYAYYPTVVRRAISPDISDYLAFAMPTQAVWALGVGVICDYFSTVNVMAAMCILLATVFGMSLAPQIAWLQYLSASLLVLSQCSLFEVKFTYVQEMFDPYNYGKLVGMLGVVGGIGTFVNIPVSTVASFKHVFIAYLCVMPVTLGLVALLAWRQKIMKISYKTLPQTAQLDDALASPEAVV